MKTKLTILTLIATTALARADLIDLTPGGFNMNLDPWPTVVTRFFHQYQRDQINLAGAQIANNQVTWSPFTLFGDDFFDITANGTTASVSWDLANAQGGFHVGFVLIETLDAIMHLYGVSHDQWLDGGGSVIADGNVNVASITFAGSNTIPDDLNTLFGFLIPLVTLGWISLFPKYHNP